MDEEMNTNMWEAQNSLNKIFIEQFEDLHSKVEQLKKKIRKQRNSREVKE